MEEGGGVEEGRLSGLRIVYVAPRYSPHLGGVEYVVKNFAERLASRGNEVTVVCGESKIKKTVVEEVNKVRVIRVPTYAPGEAYHVPRDRGAVARVLRDDSVDIVHSHSVHALISFLPLRMKKLIEPDWKLVMTLHFSTPGYTFIRRALWGLVWRRYVARYLKYVDLIHATSSLEAGVVSKYFPMAKGRILTMPLGIDEDVLNYGWKGRDSDFLFYSGRLEKYKRVDLAVRAISHLVKRRYSIRLVVTGSGSYQERIVKEAVRELGGAAGRFIVVDSPRPRKEYLELVSSARAVINLSAAENFNVFLAEAYTVGVPIIATREAAAFHPEMANVEVLDPDYVADVILKELLGHGRKDHKYKLKTWQKVVMEIESTYRSLLNA